MIQRLCLLLLLLLPISAMAAASSEQYVLDDGDRISIKVYGEDDLSMDILLSTRGSFDYPYLAGWKRPVSL